jgi:hypothetical protein
VNLRRRVARLARAARGSAEPCPVCAPRRVEIIELVYDPDAPPVPAPPPVSAPPCCPDCGRPWSRPLPVSIVEIRRPRTPGEGLPGEVP